MSGSSKSTSRQVSSTLLGQRGVVIPIVVVGLLALLAVGGLALDASHALANKTRMQNTVDAAALAAAKVLDLTEDTVQARAAAYSVFSRNADGAGNHELKDAMGEIYPPEVQFSKTVSPFSPGSDGPFVRVIATGFDTQTTLTRVLGIDKIPTPATAVAGPSGPLGFGEGAEICDVAPIAVCEHAIPGYDPDDDDDDVLRVLTPKPGDTSAIGPGNYKLLRMHDEDGEYCNPNNAAGGKCLKNNLAGAAGTCVEYGGTVDTEDHDETIKTQPGKLTGPVRFGFNSRFDELGGGLDALRYYPDQYIDEQGGYELKSCEHRKDSDAPVDNYIFLANKGSNNYCREKGKKFGEDFDPADDPSTWPDSNWKNDYVTSPDQLIYNYCNYSGAKNCTPGPGAIPGAKLGENGVPDRRLLLFPVVPCEGMATGTSTLDVTGVACFFMLQSVGKGQNNGNGQIFGEYVTDKCPANGNAGSISVDEPSGPLLYKIQLYKDPDSRDS